MIPLSWLVFPTLAGLAVGIIRAIPSPRYAPGYRPSAAASLEGPRAPLRITCPAPTKVPYDFQDQGCSGMAAPGPAK